MPLCLPQDEKNPAARQSELQAEAKKYAYNRDYYGALFINSVPHEDNYDAAYAKQSVATVAAMEKNRALQNTSTWPEKDGTFSKLAELPAADAVAGMTKHLMATAGKLPQERPTNVSGYADLISSSARKPLSLDRADDDLFFAWQMIAGTTPIMLQGIDQLPGNLPLDAATYARAVGNKDTLAAALAEGRLFLSDYKLWDGIPTGETDGLKKHLHAPLALFSRLADGQLHPVCIQCDQQPGEDNPIWTPQDGIAWRMAKAIVASADITVNGVVAHFGLVHLVAEAFICISHRQLSKSHPLMHFLLPHFQYTLPVNKTALDELVNKGGFQETVLSGTLDANFRIMLGQLAAIPFNAAGARADFQRRKLDNTTALPMLPFRDDGVPIADALRRWTSEYLHIYYASDAAVRADTEVAAWAAELAGPGGFNNMPTFDSIDALSGFVGDMLWRLTGMHAVINYGGWDSAAWSPFMPASIYSTGPKAGATEQDWALMMPPLDVANRMLELMLQLGSIRFNKLGDYPAGYFEPAVTPALDRFRASLQTIATETKARDAQRPWSFPFLYPDQVPMSVEV
jgi:arachidonate 15-lipoxygenase